MAEITTLTQMKNYVLRKLGSPVINIEIASVQLEQCIEDGVQIINRYMYGESIYRDYLTFSATSGTDEYSLSGNNVTEVFEFVHNTTTNGINTLFSPMNTLLYSDWVVKGNYPGAGSSNLSMTNYNISMNYLEEINRMFGREYSVDYRPLSQTLKITPTPIEDLVGIILVYRKSEAVQVYNHPFCKKLCVALAKQQWGMNSSKYSGVQLPGGGSINSERLIDEGKQEEEQILEKIRNESEPIDFFIA